MSTKQNKEQDKIPTKNLTGTESDEYQPSAEELNETIDTLIPKDTE